MAARGSTGEMCPEISVSTKTVNVAVQTRSGHLFHPLAYTNQYLTAHGGVPRAHVTATYPELRGKHGHPRAELLPAFAPDLSSLELSEGNPCVRLSGPPIAHTEPNYLDLGYRQG